MSTVMSKMHRHKDHGWYGQLIVKTSIYVSLWNDSQCFDTIEEAEEYLKSLGYVEGEEDVKEVTL